MGILHAGILNALSNCKVTAVCENDPIVSRVAKKILRDVSFYSEVSKMLTDTDVDALFITSPIQTHALVILAALQSSPSVALFSEKPLAMNGTEASEIANKVATNGAINMVGFHKRFSPVFRDAKRLIDSGVIGKIQFLKSYSYSADVFRRGEGWRFRKEGGGALLDLGPHILDLILWFFGDPERVTAFERSLYSSEVEDYVHVTLRFPSGLIGSLDISWSARGYRLPEIRLDMQGTNGSMIVCDDYIKIQVEETVPGVMDSGIQLLQKPSYNTNVDFLLADPEYTLEDKYFVKAAEEKTQTVPDFHTAAKVNHLVDLIHKNATVR